MTDLLPIHQVSPVTSISFLPHDLRRLMRMNLTHHRILSDLLRSHDCLAHSKESFYTARHVDVSVKLLHENVQACTPMHSHIFLYINVDPRCFSNYNQALLRSGDIFSILTNQLAGISTPITECLIILQ